MIVSPCIGVCQVDGQTQTCVGCHRTLAEIGQWMYMSDDERRTIMARLEASRETPPGAYDG
jgi:predicted Fe-S protein YdhL (DUF1289 family)